MLLKCRPQSLIEGRRSLRVAKVSVTVFDGSGYPLFANKIFAKQLAKVLLTKSENLDESLLSCGPQSGDGVQFFTLIHFNTPFSSYFTILIISLKKK